MFFQPRADIVGAGFFKRLICRQNIPSAKCMNIVCRDGEPETTAQLANIARATNTDWRSTWTSRSQSNILTPSTLQRRVDWNMRMVRAIQSRGPRALFERVDWNGKPTATSSLHCCHVSTDAWIETNIPAYASGRIAVAPSRGAWIETGRLELGRCHEQVAPRTRCV